MRAIRIIFTLILLVFVVSLAACGGDIADIAPDSETGDVPLEAPPGDDAYPAPEEIEGAEEAPAYPGPAESADSAEAPGYPAPQEGVDSAEAPGYPAPVDESDAVEEGANPAPDDSAAQTTGEAYPGAGETDGAPAVQDNTLLAEPDNGATLTNRVWNLQQFTGQSGETLLPTPDVVEINTVEFFEDGRVSIVAGCNVARGDYSAADGSINIQAVNQTKQNCDAASLGGQFLQWLNQVAGYQIEGESLSLLLPESSGEVALQGSEIMSFGDQYVKFLISRASLGLPAAQPETLDELMDASLDNLVYHEGDPVNLAFGQAPGAVVLIQSPAGSMVKSDGLAIVEDNKPMAALDRLEIGSNTKMFTGVLLTQLVEEGVLALDDPLSTWLPEMALTIPYGDEITLRHLATHTSGIPDYGDAVIGAGAADSEALRSGYTPEELVAIAIENSEPDFTPGEPNKWNYSNTGYILLGMVLEAATGQSYGDLLQQRIFGPLRMNNTELLEGVPYPNSIVDGYFVFPYDINTTEWNGTQGWAAGAIISTASDTAKFASALMTGAVFSDPATLEVMTDFIEVSENEAVGSVGGSGYGIGLIEFAPGLWGHRGQTVGFTSIIAMDPAKDFVMIALTNSAEGSTYNEQALMGHFLNLDGQ